MRAISAAWSTYQQHSEESESHIVFEEAFLKRPESYHVSVARMDVNIEVRYQWIVMGR